MKQRLHRYVKWIGVLLFPVLIGTGCAVTNAADATAPQSPVSTSLADLRGLETVVERVREGDSVKIEKGDQVEVQVNDRIAVDKQGRGLLAFHQDRLLVEIFRDSELLLSEARLDPEGSIFVRMNQTFGTTRAELHDLADTRVELETDYATITALGGDAEVLVCHAEAVTCMATLKGTAQVEALGEVVTVNAGEATYIFPGEPPRPALCAQQEELEAWMDKKRSNEELPPLGKVVSGWPQEPCQAQASSTTQEPVSTDLADLKAVEMLVERVRDGNSVEVPKGDQVEVQVNDRIAVDKQGRGLLAFHQDRLLVEIFRDSELLLSEARLDPEGSIFVRMNQTFGTTRAELNDLADARVELETDYATITALGGDAEVLVCHAEVATCMATLKGTAQVEALGEVITVNAGEATYIFPGEPPRPALCAQQEELEAWMDKKRGTEDVPPLKQIVVGWPQEPCQAQPPSAASPNMPAPDGMVKIEGGRYEVGKPGADDYHMAAEEIQLPAFWIDEHEVTNAQYQAFLDETGKAPPVNWPGEDNHPVKGVTWEEAATYCAWANKRLPTEAEWEVAARGPGPEPALYPWGSDPSAGGQAYDLPLDGTYQVGSQPFNRSPFGVYDMAGNVWEWVGEPYGPVEDGQKIVRGGRHGLLRDMAYRQMTEPNDQRFVALAGFRCAADQVEGE